MRLKIKRNNYYFLTYFLIFVLIIKNFIGDFSISFGDSFNFYHPSVNISKYLSTWLNYDFGVEYNRNLHSTIIYVALGKLIKIDPSIFFQIFISVYILICFVSLIILSNKFLIELNIIQNFDKNLVSIFFILLFFCNPLILQYLASPDLSLLISLLLMPCLYLSYYNFVKNLNYHNIFTVILVLILFTPSFNNILGPASVFIGLLPLIIIFKKNKNFIRNNLIFFSLVFFIFLPNLYVSIVPLLEIQAGNVENLDNDKLQSWFIWMSTNSSIFNILQSTNYVGWNDPLSVKVWTFYDYVRTNFFSLFFLLLGPIGFLYFLKNFKFISSQFKIIIIFILIMLFLCKGYNFPFKEFNIFIYKNVFLYKAFRSIHILSFSLIFYITIIKIFFLIKLSDFKFSKRLKFFYIIPFVIFVNFFVIYVHESFLRNILKVKIPKDFYELIEKVNNTQKFERILSNDFKLNQTNLSSWGLMLNGNPFVANFDKEYLYSTLKEKNFNFKILNKIDLNNLSNVNNYKILKFLGIDAILVRDDLTYIFNGYYLPKDKLKNINENNDFNKIINTEQNMYNIYSINDIKLISQPNKYVKIN